VRSSRAARGRVGRAIASSSPRIRARASFATRAGDGTRMTSNTALPPAQGDDLFELRAVRRVAETGSSAATARALGVRVSTVTRAVQRVEERLGTRLFLRSTHGLAAT